MLTAGTTLGPYKILAPIGAGGMGEVYRAHDSRLGRDVAIKTLPESFATDPERLARFEREAKVLASLNHPNIGAIYGLEEAGHRRYLVLEYVEGETLGARLARGPLPLEEAVEICLQVATGMEAAHERGIVHRDLKPGNVMITPGDLVKVVDFGLAKGVVAEPEEISPDSPTATESPVVGTPATLPGVILGTAAYLSPEQARAKAVDRRADIWSFGCVLYECLTGRRTFEGETVSDVLAGILKGEVEWSRLPKGTPPRLRELLQHCLEKDPRKRLRDIGDARLALEEIREGKSSGVEATHAPLANSPHWIAIALLLTVTAAAAGIAFWNGIGPGRDVALAARQVRRSCIEFPAEILVSRWGMSPDGRFVFARGRPRTKNGEEPAPFRAYRRRMDKFEFEEIIGSENTFTIVPSPDGRWLYLLRPIREGSGDLQLVKVLTEGGTAPVTVSNWDASWVQWFAVLGNGDVVVTTQSGTAYVRIPASGAAPSAPIRFECPDSATFGFAESLPGDRGILLYAKSYEGGELHLGAGVLDLKSGKAKVLVRDATAHVCYSRTGHLLFTRGSRLLAVPFDLKALEVRGEPVAVADGILSTGIEAWYFISRDGTLLYRAGGVIGEHRRAVAVDEQGRVSARSPAATHEGTPISSPDGNRVACVVTNPKMTAEIWVSERGVPTRRVAAREGVECYAPVWSPDGKAIAYARRGHDRADGLYVQSLDGGAPRRICGWYPGATGIFFPTSWSPDGRFLLANVVVEGGGPLVGYGDRPADVVRVEVSPGGDTLGAPTVLLSGPANQGGARFSPDGRWVAYFSNETGSGEVHVAPWHQDGSLGRSVSLGRGGSPHWGRTGREVFFQRSRRVMSASLKHQTMLSASPPVQRWDLDSLRAAPLGWDILPGPQLLIVQKEEGEESFDEATRLACVFNFFEDLKQGLRAARN